MFVIELIYKTDLAKIDAHMTEHVRFLNKNYAAGNFLVSGQKIPRDGVRNDGFDRPATRAYRYDDSMA